MIALVQSLSKSLAFIKEQLQGARSGFEALVAYFGENSGAFQNDGDFWRDVTTFVAAFSAAQQDALAFEQVRSCRLILECSSLLASVLVSCNFPVLALEPGWQGFQHSRMARPTEGGHALDTYVSDLSCRTSSCDIACCNPLLICVISRIIMHA